MTKFSQYAAGADGGRPRRARSPGFTLIELLLVLLVIGILAALLLPVVSKAKKRGVQAQCLSGLKQVGVAAHAFAHDHAEGFPFQVSTNTGGTMEFVRTANSLGGDVYFAFRHFQALSNELGVTGLLLCPADARSIAPDFVQLRNENISFFAAVSAEYSQPDSVLAGDRNIAVSGNQGGAVLQLNRNTPVAWTADGHEFRGNLLFADGRVENTSKGGLQMAVESSPGPISAWAPVASASQSAGASGPGGNGQGTGGSGGNTGGGAGGGGSSSGFAVVQNFFQQTTINNPPPYNSPPSTPTDSRPPSTPPPTVPPPGVPPPAMAQKAAKPAPDMAKANKPGEVALAPAAEKPDGAGTDAAAQQPINIMLLMVKPETCWSCWLAIVLGALLAAVLMAWAMQRQRQQRREARSSSGEVSSDAGSATPASRPR